MASPMPRRRVRHAVVPERSAHAIALKLGPQIRALARRYGVLDPELGRELLDSLDELASVGREWLEDERAAQAAHSHTDDIVPAGRELTTHEVAVRFGVSERQVVNLISDGKLAARKPRGKWLIEEDSVLALEQQRRREQRSA